jgi:hypothetical protein
MLYLRKLVIYLFRRVIMEVGYKVKISHETGCLVEKIIIDETEAINLLKMIFGDIKPVYNSGVLAVSQYIKFIFDLDISDSGKMLAIAIVLYLSQLGFTGALDKRIFNLRYCGKKRLEVIKKLLTDYTIDIISSNKEEF